jgi:predicted transposase YbfD/YdcC
MVSMLCGLDQLQDIVVFANERLSFFKKHFSIDRIPSKPTLSRMLSIINAKSVSKVIIGIVKDEVKELGEIVSFDGKAIRSTSEKGRPHSALQILTAYMVESGVVLAQDTIHEKTNEIPVMRDILDQIDIEEKIVTTDAMHCQRETCAQIIDEEHGGDYVIGLKENQRTLHDDVALLFKDAINDDSIETHSETELNGGRLERRICRSTREIGFLSEHNWPGLKSVFEVRRIITAKDSTLKSDETSYYISSLEASPAELLRISRAHWGIESMHWLLDSDFSEDDCGLLSDNGQEVFNILRKLALLLHKQYMAKQPKKRSIKSNLLRCLINENALMEIISSL